MAKFIDMIAFQLFKLWIMFVDERGVLVSDDESSILSGPGFKKIEAF